jgi:UDP-N-acetylmuramoyl-tripeptide--D-alanyl-D-alanine ligase
MTTSLWTAFEIAAAADGEVQGAFVSTGVAFDSREVSPGDLFVALKGEVTDGHRFVAGAFERGAAGAIVSEPIDHPHVLVNDTMAALEAIASEGRARSSAQIIGVTGSVGKTGTKEALFEALDRKVPGKVHRSIKSYNNHTGVPLSLARMPPDMRYGVFEMGMNHPGELAHLTQLVRPHVAIVTAIAPAHAAYFPDESAIADAKGEIFQGLQPGGTAIIPYDSPHRQRLIEAARPHAARILTFGRDEGADVRALEELPLSDGSTLLSVLLPESQLTFSLSQPGEHWVSNALAVLAAVEALGGDAAAAGVALADMKGLPGRGIRVKANVDDGQALVIDESYNANPASMAATLKQLGREKADRKVVILGEMRELGTQSPRYHAELAQPMLDAGVEAALLVGHDMAALADRLEGRMKLRHVADAAAALKSLPEFVTPGDVILIKGSNAIGLSRIVKALGDGALASGKTTCSI